MKALLLLLALLPSSRADAAWQRLQGGGLSYWLYSPAAAAGTANALMVNLHGCAQHADDLKTLGNWEGAAEKNRMYVALPDVPSGAMMGCWNYYGRNQTETNNHNGPLLALTESLVQNPALRIDPAHVFVSGLSSGATQAMLLGCLRPDLFAGVALNSGPALGSEMAEISNPHTTAAQAAQFCRSLAGGHSSAFARQRASLIRGDQDFIVNIQHSDINAAAFAQLYGAADKAQLDLAKVPGSDTAGTGSLYRDSAGTARIAFLVNQGLSHNWAAGNARGGASQHYINPSSVDYPDFLGDFFSGNAPQ